METKHTKGEWFVYNEKEISQGTESLGIDCKNESGRKSIILFNNCGNNDPDEELANAKLIAAAPELLEALINLTNTCKKYFRDDFDLTESLNAIKKAVE